MLTAIPEQIARASRQMVLRAPNTIPCMVYRKKVNRTGDDTVGGLPTVGGIGIMDSEDEADFTFEPLGEGRMLFSGTYTAAPNNINDSDDGVTYADGAMECSVEPLVEGAFVVGKHDMIQAMPGMGFIMPYEVVGKTSPTSIPPYIRKLIVESRADQDVGI